MMVPNQLNTIDLNPVLQDLHGDTVALHKIANAYLAELPQYQQALTSSDASLQQISHRLRAVFGIFRHEAGIAISGQVERCYKESQQPTAAQRQQLADCMFALGQALQQYLNDNAPP